MLFWWWLCVTQLLFQLTYPYTYHTPMSIL